MNRFYSVTAPAVAILWCVGSAFGPPTAKVENSTRDAQAIFSQIGEHSASIADRAYRLSEMAMRDEDSGDHLAGLVSLRRDVNEVSSELRSLEAMRNSLSGWQVRTLDEVLPIMNDAASNTEKALLTFNADRDRLWSTSYPQDTSTVYKDASQVSTLLHDQLKLAKTREEELRTVSVRNIFFTRCSHLPVQQNAGAGESESAPSDSEQKAQ